MIGLAIALLRVSANRAARWLAIGYIRLFQGTPLLLQLFLVFFGADMLGHPARPLSVSAALGFSVNAGAFLGEIWRGCDPGGAPWPGRRRRRRSGLHYWPRMMARGAAAGRSAPRSRQRSGFLVNLIKSTSLAAIIGFVELTRAGQMLNNCHLQAVPDLWHSRRDLLRLYAGRSRSPAAGSRRGWRWRRDVRRGAIRADAAMFTTTPVLAIAAKRSRAMAPAVGRPWIAPLRSR